MPLGKSGKHFSNPAVAKMHDSMDAPKDKMAEPPAAPPDAGGMDKIEISKNPDGTFSTMCDGQAQDFPSFGDALSQVASYFGEGADEQAPPMDDSAPMAAPSGAMPSLMG